MVFLQEKLLYRQYNILALFFHVVTILITLLAASMLPESAVAVSVSCSALSTLWFLAIYESRINIVSIDEAGIKCYRAEELLWFYQWDDIVELLPSSRYNQPSVEIMIYMPPCLPGQAQQTGHYFQLCKEAKIALAKYCDIEKRKKFHKIH